MTTISVDLDKLRNGIRYRFTETDGETLTGTFAGYGNDPEHGVRSRLGFTDVKKANGSYYTKSLSTVKPSIQSIEVVVVPKLPGDINYEINKFLGGKSRKVRKSRKNKKMRKSGKSRKNKKTRSR